MNSEGNKVLFIVNKFAGGSYQPHLDGKIIETCEQLDIECTIEFTLSRGHATELASEAVATNKFSKVIAVGGDGTVNEVAKGLLRSNLPMGIIPKGSGNGLARHLEIPLKIADAVRNLMTSQVVAIDTFQMNGKLSLNVSGIGFDGHIANLFSKEKKRGLQGYVKHALKEFLTFKEFEAELRTEKGTFTRKIFVVAIANSSQYGNNARVAPAASVCDRLLHINMLKKVPPYRIDFIYSLFKGTISESSYCEIFETNDMTIKLNKPMSYHIDGEPCGKSDIFHIELLPASLKMLIPEHKLQP